MPPTLGNFTVDLISALGGRANPASRKLFESWQRWEGGWTANAARFNPLNLTAPGSGLPTINSVGVVSMPSYQEGLRRTANLIKSGYPSIARAMASGQVDFADPGLQGDLNRWLSGKRTPGMTPYVSKIARSYGANVPAGTSPASTSPQGAAPQAPLPRSPQAPTAKSVFNPELFRAQIRQGFLAGGGRIDLMQLPGALERSWEIVEQTPKLPPVAAEAGARKYGGTTMDPGLSVAPNEKVTQALQIAKAQIGKPYVFGSTGPSAFDCSGLIEYAFEKAGIKTPGRLWTGTMSKMGQQVGWKNIQPGDWIVRHSGGAGHVVMYVGGGQVIAAPHSGTVVQYQPLSKFMQGGYQVRRWTGK